MAENEKKPFNDLWVGHEAYQCGMATWAVSRHGSRLQLKGIVHECTYVVRHNLNPDAVFRKGVASLHPNVRSCGADVLFSRGGGVQLKDTISASGARETALRASSYNVPIHGTDETVAAVARRGAKLESSGISSAHNEGIAARAGSVSTSTFHHALNNARSGALAGAALGVAAELVRGGYRWFQGELSAVSNRETGWVSL